jgi:COP9 signalosome complex subunit 5
MLGRPDPHKSTNLIVTDAFPLPIEGFETRVVADDQDVVNHMIALGERLEKTRKEKFMGWYHSHPFDLVLGEDARSHCFLSQTDLSTQLQWQRAEDPHGNPFAAIVVDPLLSMHTGTPQLKAFRAYPPEFQSAICNECPDGSVVSSEKQRLEKWGSCWNRYYELKVEYYMSAASRSVLGDLTQNYLWMKSFQRDSKEGGVGDSQGVSASEATKVATLREIATDVKYEVGSGSEGRTATLPISRASKIEPLVRKLRETATLAMTQQTARSVQQKIFSAPK